MYTTADDLFSKRNDFNAMVPGRDPQVFVSEYAVNVAAGWGNLKVGGTPLLTNHMQCMLCSHTILAQGIESRMVACKDDGAHSSMQ